MPGQSGKVLGELYLVSNVDSVFVELDKFEGPTYRRARVEVTTGFEIVEAWAYESEAPKSSAELVEGGDFQRFRRVPINVMCEE